ncbi:conserved hypothetical protein [Alteromonas sp. 38]|nr:conserved hypothetical protein [Alteromonas sp. 154]VXB14935.1 conserved hypothetical protein [Alteromonas sp. 38]
MRICKIFICLFILGGCQMVPDEKDEHIFVLMQVDGSYKYDGQIYNAKDLSKELKARFMANRIPSRKIEIHCLKYLKFHQLGDLNVFSQNNIKPVDTKDFRFESECSGNDIKWDFDS